MLTAQLLVVLLSAAKRFDSLVLHFRSSVREAIATMRNFRSGGEADLG